MPLFLRSWKLRIEVRGHFYTFEILQYLAGYPFQAFIFKTSVFSLLRRNLSKLRGLSLKGRNHYLLRESNEKHKCTVGEKKADVEIDGA
jgi:hypothetical protein